MSDTDSTTTDIEAEVIDHPAHDPDRPGWAYRLAAPMAVGEPVEPVPLWCRDHAGRWWLVVAGERIRRLTDIESARAALHIPLASRSPIDTEAIMGDLLPSPDSGAASAGGLLGTRASTGPGRPALVVLSGTGGRGDT